MLSEKAKAHLDLTMSGENNEDSREIAAAIDQALAGASGDIKSNGSVPFTANQSMGGNNLTNVLDPVNPQDAATKAYVLANAGGSGAKTDLSNLIATAINQSLVPASDNTLNVGSPSDLYATVFSHVVSGPAGDAGTPSLNFNSGSLFAGDGSFASILFGARVLVDPSGNGAINWQNRQLKNSSDVSVLDWSALTPGMPGQFLKTDGAGNVSYDNVPGGSLANVYYVGPSYTFPTIQAAINQAVTDGAGSSHSALILIAGGSYTENLTLASGITLKALDEPLNYNDANFGGIDQIATLSDVQIMGIHTYTVSSGTAATNSLFFERIYFNQTSNTGNSFTLAIPTSAGAEMNFNKCRFFTGTGIAHIMDLTGQNINVSFDECTFATSAATAQFVNKTSSGSFAQVAMKGCVVFASGVWCDLDSNSFYGDGCFYHTSGGTTFLQSSGTRFDDYEFINCSFRLGGNTTDSFFNSVSAGDLQLVSCNLWQFAGNNQKLFTGTGNVSSINTTYSVSNPFVDPTISFTGDNLSPPNARLEAVIDMATLVINAAYAVTDQDHNVICDLAGTSGNLTLPAAVDGREMSFMAKGTGSAVYTFTGGTMDANTNPSIQTSTPFQTLLCKAGTWYRKS